MSTSPNPLVWDFYRQVDGAVGLGAAVEYYDEASQSLYLASGLKTQVAQIEEGHWSEAEPGAEITISSEPYTASAWDHPLTGQLFGVGILDGRLTFLRYLYAKEVSQLLKSGSIQSRNDSQIAQTSLRLSNIGEDYFLGPASLFMPGARMSVAVTMGNSAPYKMAEAYVDEFDYDRNSSDVSLSGRNGIGYLLNAQTFDDDTVFVGTGHQVVAWILGLAGITRCHIGPSEADRTWTFEPDDTLLKGIEAVLEVFPGWEMIQLPDGYVCVGYAAFLAQYQVNSVYVFDGNTDVTKRKTKRSADAAYAKVRVTGKAADGTELTPVLLDVPCFDHWSLGARKTKHVKAEDGLTQEELQAFAEQQRDELQHIGIGETFDGPMRPWLLVGDIASITYDGEQSEDLGLITSVTHSFGTSGFFTSFAIDSGGTASAQTRSGDIYATASASVNGYNRDQGLADLIGVIGRGKDGKPGANGKDGKDGEAGATGPQGPAGPAGPNTVSSTTTTNLTGILKGNGSTVSAAVAGTDYAAPASVEAKADKADLTSISTTGATNNSGGAIAAGTYFYKDGVLACALTSIASGATLTLDTNYEVVTAGGLNDLGGKAFKCLVFNVQRNETLTLSIRATTSQVFQMLVTTGSVPDSSSRNVNGVYFCVGYGTSASAKAAYEILSASSYTVAAVADGFTFKNGATVGTRVSVLVLCDESGTLSGSVA